MFYTRFTAKMVKTCVVKPEIFVDSDETGNPVVGVLKEFDLRDRRNEPT